MTSAQFSRLQAAYNPKHNAEFLKLVFICFFIPRYEHFGSDQKRTLINKFVSSICWTGMEFAIVVQGVNITRFCLGPLPPLLCLFKAVVLTSVAMQVRAGLGKDGPPCHMRPTKHLNVAHKHILRLLQCKTR